MDNRNLRLTLRSVVAALAMLVLSATAVFADDGIILEPQHGIPLVIVNIDESEDAIAAAEANDDKHDYGTIVEMNESENHSVRCVGSVEIKVPEGYDLPGSDTTWVGKSLTLDYIRGRGNSICSAWARARNGLLWPIIMTIHLYTTVSLTGLERSLGCHITSKVYLSMWS